MYRREEEHQYSRMKWCVTLKILKTGVKIMGPYSRGTTHGIGTVIETVYEYPILMLLGVAVVTALFIWYRKKSAK